MSPVFLENYILGQQEKGRPKPRESLHFSSEEAVELSVTKHIHSSWKVAFNFDLLSLNCALTMVVTLSF